MHEKIEDLGNSSRRNDIRFDMLSQAPGENWHGSETKIKVLIKEKLGIKNVEIERALRIGKEERDEFSQI